MRNAQDVQMQPVNPGNEVQKPVISEEETAKVYLEALLKANEQMQEYEGSTSQLLAVIKVLIEEKDSIPDGLVDMIGKLEQ